MIPRVIGEWETVQKLKEGYSIARYGDGEYKLCLDTPCKSQNADPALGERLRSVLKSNSERCLIGIPNIYDKILAYPGTKSHHFWTTMRQRTKYTDLLDPEKLYYSSFITRPDNAPSINCPEFYDLCKSLWVGRNVVIITGRDVAFCKNKELLQGAYIMGIIEGAPVNGWSDYESIMSRARGHDKDTLFLIRFGPTATVLAYDLCQAGYQALDLGHFGMFYNRFMSDKEVVDYDNSKSYKNIGTDNA